MVMSWPAAIMFGGMGASWAVHWCGAWQSMHERTLLTRYAPRSRRAGVLSNLIWVRGRVRGPMNGRQPMVKLIPTARSRTKTTNIQTQTLAAFFICARVSVYDLRAADE